MKMDWTFAASGPLDASLELAEGSISVDAADVTEATVSLEPMGRREDRAIAAIEEAEVSYDGQRLVVKIPKHVRRQGAIRMEIAIPHGSSVTARTASANVDVRGVLGDVDVATASGDVDCVGEAATAKVDTASGDATVGRVHGSAQGRTASGEINFESVGGELNVATASGDIEVGEVGGEATLNTASGDIRVHRLGAGAKVRAVSGDVELCLVERGDVTVSTTSGDVSVFVAKGVGTWLDVTSFSGTTSCTLPGDDGIRTTADLRLTCQTMSGDIDIRSADTPDSFSSGPAA
jgi:DUF4097 and DUF4098 domain-containing protein YvlB